MQNEILISKREILAVLFRHRWSGFAVFLSSITVAAFLVFYLISPSYETDAVVIINNSFLTHPLRDAPPDSDLEKMITFHTQRDVFESTRLAIEVVKRTNLAETRVIGNKERLGILIGDVKKEIGHWLDIEKWKVDWDPQAAAVGAVDDWVETFAIPDSKALLVTYRAKNAVEAELVLRTLLEVHSEYYYDVIRQKAMGVVKFLRKEFDISKKELVESESALLSFKKEVPFSSAKLAEKYGLSPNDLPSFAGISDSSKIQDELKLYVLKLEEELRENGELIGNKKRNRLKEDLRKRIDIYIELINSLPAREVRHVRLTRQFQKHQADYLLLQRNLTRALLVAEGQTEDMRLVDVFEKPTVNKAPVSPKKKMTLILSAVLGFILSLTWVFLIDFLDHTIRSPSEIPRYLGIRVLGSIRKLK
jgi:uncharacterized protein involved in exopolysaccharide biosynthesis